jgi:6-phosphogluconolactonase (cycloisomerase 2 family)
MIARYPSDSSRQGSPNGLAIEPSGRFLYVTNDNSQAISAFSIDNSTGVLTPLSGTPVATGLYPGGPYLHPTGKFLYVTNGGDGTISGYTINSTSGALTLISGSPFAATNSGMIGIYNIAFSN